MRAIAAVIAAAGFSGCMIDFGPSDRYQSDFHYSYDLQAGGRIDAESFNGAIEIEGWDRSGVEINGTKYGSSEAVRDDVKIDLRHTADSLEIRAIKPSGLVHGGAGARFTIHVPRGAKLVRVSTSNGPIKVRGVAEVPRLTTSNGPITVADVAGEVDARTSNGTIDAESIHGPATLRTSNGRIRVEGLSGALEAETSNGSISARLGSAPDAVTRLKTSNGPVDLTFGAAPRADVKVETRNNSISVRLPSGANARIVADTSNGSIRSDFDVSSQSGERAKHHLEGPIGSGGPIIELSTSNASIHILKGNGGSD